MAKIRWMELSRWAGIESPFSLSHDGVVRISVREMRDFLVLLTSYNQRWLMVFPRPGLVAIS